MISNVSWTPSAYKTDGATQTTADTVSNAAQTAAQSLPPAARSAFQTLVQGNVEELLTPGAGGSLPADLSGALQKLEGLAAAVAAFQQAATDPAALAALLISSMFSQERNAQQMAVDESQMSIYESQQQATALNAAANATQTAATQNFVCSVVAGAVQIAGGLFAIYGASQELSGLSELETGGDLPDAGSLTASDDEGVQTDDSEGSGDFDDALSASGEDGLGGASSAQGAAQTKSTDSQLNDDETATQNDESNLDTQEQFKVNFARIDATGKRFSGIAQVLQAAGQMISAGGNYADAIGRSDSQQDQAQADLDQAAQQQAQQFYNFFVGFLQATQSFIGAMIDQYSGILQAQTGEGQAVSKALANI